MAKAVTVDETTPEPDSSGTDLRGQLTPGQMRDLAAPLRKDVVAKRKQGGIQVSYIEAHHAIREANRIFGFSAWSRSTLEMRLVAERPYKGSNREGFLVAYVAQVRVTVRNADGTQTANDGWGYGEGITYDNPGQAHESAVKEAESDAMKRALILWGDQFGLALYDKEQHHVDDGNGHEQAPAQAAPLPPAVKPAISIAGKLGKWFSANGLTPEQAAVAREEAGYKDLDWKDLTDKQAEEIRVKARAMIPISPVTSDKAPWPEGD